MQTLIKPRTSFTWLDWKLLYQYRDLLGLWVKRDLTAKYRQTVLGPLWFMLHPLVTALVFVLIFSRGLQIATEGIPASLFYLTGLLVWNYVSQCLNSTSMTLVAHSGLFKKVFFPRLILPLSYCLSSLVAMGIQLGVLGGIYFILVIQGADTRPSLFVFALPVLIFQLIILSFGLGLWISALTVRFRDFHHLWSLFSPLWLYASPISYPLSAIPTHLRWVVELNPLTYILEGFRLAFLGKGIFNWEQWAVSALFTFLIGMTGVFIFQKMERSCVDSL